MPYSEDVLTFQDLDRKDFFLQKIKTMKISQNNRQIEMAAQDAVIKNRFKYRYFYRNRPDSSSKSECSLSIAIGVMCVNSQVEQRMMDYDPTEEGPFFQLVPLVGNRYISWNDCSIVSKYLKYLK